MEERTHQDARGQQVTASLGLADVPKNLRVTKRRGEVVPLEVKKIRSMLERVTRGLTSISIEMLIQEVIRSIYDGVSTKELEQAVIFAAVSFIEKDPEYDTVAVRLLLQHNYRDAFGASVNAQTFDAAYRRSFITSINKGIQAGILTPKLLEFDLEKLASLLQPERDNLLTYLGLQTLYERYFLKINNQRLETPQTFWMRVAMGLALNEPNKNERVAEFYEIFSTLRYVSSTPTLFHSGYVCPQLSSCFLSTVSDDLTHIFKCIGDNAQLAKWAGGIANDWTNIRATGANIRSIHSTSQGVIPFLKIVNDVVVGITKWGIRRGGTVVYLEVWHYDFEDFLDLRRNTGDERRRTHDMNTASWIPDLFMKRVMQDGEWTLFSPDETSDLHDLYGKKFEQRYQEYEQMAREGKIRLYKTMSAQKLWRKMLTRLFETGHPWITFKDSCNVRSPQDHVGVIHSSNLCTEITLNTSPEETAVCNLGSINLARHTINGIIDEALLEQTITTAVRMLDNVIDLNFYPTKEAGYSNAKHRPVGLGVMGFQDALFKLDVPFCSDEAIDVADWLQEKVSYYAIKASSDLAAERGTYETYTGSKWDRGIFPLDTLDLLQQERDEVIEVSRLSRMDWPTLKLRVKQQGMRNSNVMAIAPTATIANIAGCYPCIEPIYRNIYVKSNIAGEFTIVNKDLVMDLKKLGLWDQEMLEQIKYYDGQISDIPTIPAHLKRKYQGAFELDPIHMLKITAARGKWIDQSQSHNVFMQGVEGKKLDDIYKAAWRYGLKTTYYLRTLGASQIEKSTLDAKKFGYTQKREYKPLDDTGLKSDFVQPTIMPASSLSKTMKTAACQLDENCESCQ
jgi:ribonucleoside-diphosphate reductase alpha chain